MDNESKNEDFLKISTAILTRVTGPLPFDIFIKRAEDKFTKIFVKNMNIDKVQLKKYYSDKQVQFFYVHNEARETYSFYVEKLLEASFTDPKLLTPLQVRQVLNELLKLTLEEVYEKTKIEESTMKWANTTIKGVTQALLTDFEGVCQILKLLASRPYNMKHSFMVSIFSIILGRALGFESSRTLSNVGLGGLLHDVGMTRISKDLIDKPDLEPEEWKEIKEHPQLGVRIIDNVHKGISSEVRLIVLQHHEQPNGLGYPSGLHDKDIFPLAKIVAIAEVFTSMISKTPYTSKVFSTPEALRMMEHERGHFDLTMLAAFIKTLFPQNKSKLMAGVKFNN